MADEKKTDGKSMPPRTIPNSVEGLVPLTPEDEALLRDWFPDYKEIRRASREEYLKRPDVIESNNEDRELLKEARRQCRESGIPETPENVSALFDSLQHRRNRGPK